MSEKNEKPVEDKVTKNVTSMLSIIKESLTLDQVRLGVLTRTKRRHKELERLSRATHEKVPMAMGMHVHHETRPPKLFLTGLQAKFDGTKGAIVYMIYKVKKNPDTGKLQKILKPVFGEFNGKQIAIDGSYELENLHMEIIEYGKPIQHMIYDPKDVGL